MKKMNKILSVCAIALIMFNTGNLAFAQIDNEFQGAGSGANITTGSYNSFYGDSSGYYTTSGHHNVFVGTGTGYFNTTGYHNSFLGFQSGYSNTTGYRNSFFGIESGWHNTTGRYNSFSGYYSGYYNTTGSYNSFFGTLSGYFNTTGSYNSFLGNYSGHRNTTGRNNSFVGSYSGYRNTTGNYNSFLGYRSGYNNETGSKNVFLGYYAGYNETGSDKLYIENSSSATPLIGGDFSTDEIYLNGTTFLADGEHLQATVNGGARILGAQGNTAAEPAIGFFSANGVDDGAGGNGIFRPLANTMAFATSSTERMRITPGGYIGIGTTTPGTYRLYVAGNAYCTGSWLGSDARYKKNIKTITTALEKVKSIRGTNYEFQTEQFKNKNFSEGKQYGFIAQELKEVLPELVKQDEDGYYAVNYDAVIPVLVEAIKDQQKLIEEQNRRHQSEIAELKQLLTSGSVQSVNNTVIAESEAKLYQNNPNPFNEQTEIQYFLSAKINSASILVFDMNGKQLKSYELKSKGNNKLIINAGEFVAGMYIYSLVADGKIVDTKRMILK